MLNIVEKRIINKQFVLIAEIGVNYYDIAKKNNMELLDAAKLMIREAANAGVHAVKFQTYKAESLASKDSPYYWDLSEESTVSQYNLFKKYDFFGVYEYRELSNYAEKQNIEFLSTPFDIESADYLDNLMNIYKISSSDLNNLKFVEYQAKKNKPIVMSVGASNEDEIEKTVLLIKKYNNKPLTLLHCVLEYPTPYEHANLNKIVSLKNRFPDCVIGYSDHTKPDNNCDIIKTAYNLGAMVIEKHFTLDKTLPGNDHYHAMDTEDARKIIKEIENLNIIRGNGKLQCLESEQVARRNARRSLVSKCNIKQGMRITEEMITWKRPASGICADEIEQLIGKQAVCDVDEDTILRWEMFK